MVWCPVDKRLFNTIYMSFWEEVKTKTGIKWHLCVSQCTHAQTLSLRGMTFLAKKKNKTGAFFFITCSPLQYFLMLLSDRFTRPHDDVIYKKGNADDSKCWWQQSCFRTLGTLSALLPVYGFKECTFWQYLVTGVVTLIELRVLMMQFTYRSITCANICSVTIICI